MGTQILAHYHLPGLFEFYDFYSEFLPLYRKHPEYFYDWCQITSIYGSPEDCLWGGGRTGSGTSDSKDVFALMNEYKISPRLTFSNSLLQEIHLTDKKCNLLCNLFKKSEIPAGIIIHSDLLLDYLKKNYSTLLFYFFHNKSFNRFCRFSN